MIYEIRTADVGLSTGGAGKEGDEQELDILMRHQLEVDIRAAYQNITEFRSKFEVDKFIRSQWKEETGEDPDMAIDIQEEEHKGGYHF